MSFKSKIWCANKLLHFFLGIVIFTSIPLFYRSGHRRIVTTNPAVLTVAPNKKSVEGPPIKPIRPLLDGSKRWMQLISAFYDDRNGLGKYACIRVILIKDIKISPSQCLLLNAANQVILSKKPWLQMIGFGMGYKGSYFREEVLSCCVSRSIRPARVALIFPGENPSPANLRADVVLKVQYPPKPNGAPRTIINCVSVTFGSPDPKRVVEWLELLRLFGMDKVEIHDINMSPATRRIFEAYSQEKEDSFVEVIDMSPILAPNDYNLLHMSPAINNCLFRNMHMFKAVAVFDLDEVIVPRSHDTYEALVTHLRNLPQFKNILHKHFPFVNIYYCTDVNSNVNFSGTGRIKWTSTFTRHFYHKTPNPLFHSIKSIINPKACFAMHNHFCWADVRYEPRHHQDEAKELSKEPNHDHVDRQLGANQHYKPCLDISNLFEDRSMLKYQRRLDQRIKEKFKSLGMNK